LPPIFTSNKLNSQKENSKKLKIQKKCCTCAQNDDKIIFSNLKKNSELKLKLERSKSAFNLKKHRWDN